MSCYDAIVEDVGPKGLKKLGLSYRRLQDVAPSLVLVSLSPFGLSGPNRSWRASELCVQAAGGVMHAAGYDGEAPRKLPGETATMIAGVHGATAAISAVFGVQSGIESGVHIDISAQDTLMQHWTRHVADYAYSGMKLKRQPRSPEGIHSHHTAAREGRLAVPSGAAPTLAGRCRVPRLS